MRLRVFPITFKDACAFVKAHHRHNKPPIGHKFSIALRAADETVGVAMAGRPVARAFDDGLTLEVNRTCTDGTENANSMLYGAIWRAAKAMGYRRCITYTQAAGAVPEGWISVTERLPEEWAEIDATPCVLNGKPIGTMYTGMQVLVSLSAGGVQLDNLVCIGEDGKPWWNKYGDRVTHWREKPLSALAASPAIEPPKQQPVHLAGGECGGATLPTPPAHRWQVGTWTLTAPDGRIWQADSPLKACAAEQRDRIPPEVALKRIFDALDDDGGAT